MTNKRKNALAIAALAASSALILWITLLSRIGTNVRYYYPPLWSYRAILLGNKSVLLETIGNILLFIPFGYYFSRVFRLKRRWTIMIGICLSLLIESSQWLLHLGSFEIDDAINNTAGMYLGSTVFELIIESNGRRTKMIGAVSTVILLIITLLVINFEKQIEISRKNNQIERTGNLLILNTAPGYVGRSKFFVEYLSDETIYISGNSTIRAWKEIGNFELSPGTYILSGFSGVEEKTIGIELEYYEKGIGDYIRLTPDIGPIEETKFELSESTQVRALIGVYPGGEGEFIARPAVYRED